MERKVTMEDIANKLGISKVSVSKALNDKEGVSEELREQVKEMAQKLGYRLNNSARSLKTNRVSNVGILIAERYVVEQFGNHFGETQKTYYFNIQGQLTRKLSDFGYSSIIEVLSHEDEKGQVLPRMYNENKVDGIIVLGQLDVSYLKTLEELNLPLLYMDFYTHFSEVDSIITNNFHSAYQLTNLVIKSGHRKIGFVGNIYATSSIQDRYLGYYKALIEHQIPLNKDYVINDRNERGNLIDLDLPEELPTAFVCNCDLVAYKLINQLKEKGIRVPEDCSVVGFDNSIFATISSPQITTVDNNVDRMIDRAVKVITKKISKPSRSYGLIFIEGSIIERDSVQEI